MVSKIQQLTETIKASLASHYQQLRTLVPELEGEPGVNLAAKDPISDPITLPSNLPRRVRQSPYLTNLVELEVAIRVGLAHDALQKLRSALGYKSFMRRHTVKAFGRHDGTRGKQATRRAAIQVDKWKVVYRGFYGALMELVEPGDPKLRGLKELGEDDLAVLGDYLERLDAPKVRNRPADRPPSLPWIWTLPLLTSADPESAPARLDDGNGHPQDPEQAIEDWNWEGGSQSLPKCTPDGHLTCFDIRSHSGGVDSRKSCSQPLGRRAPAAAD